MSMEIYERMKTLAKDIYILIILLRNILFDISDLQNLGHSFLAQTNSFYCYIIILIYNIYTLIDIYFTPYLNFLFLIILIYTNTLIETFLSRPISIFYIFNRFNLQYTQVFIFLGRFRQLDASYSAKMRYTNSNAANYF